MGVLITGETAADANEMEKLPHRRSLCARVGKVKRNKDACRIRNRD